MSILIEGVEMPSKCWPCPCCVDNGLIGMNREYFCSALDSDFEIDNFEQRLSACPLKEVPALHGRLIDADAYQYSGDLIDEPTIIEAEASE